MKIKLITDKGILRSAILPSMERVDWPKRKTLPDPPRKWWHAVDLGDSRGNQM